MTPKNWDSIYEYWNSFSVPDISIINFDINCHSTYSPWFNKKEETQLYHNDNPIIQTGGHLLSYLKNKPRELVDAYKIFAFLRYHGLFDHYEIIEIPFKKYNEDFNNWWNPAAKHILPYYESINDYYNRSSLRNIKDFRILIEGAAKAWTDIANEWMLVLTPDNMDRNSEERRAYWEAVDKASEDREYQMYLRLKRKFEG